MRGTCPWQPHSKDTLTGSQMALAADLQLLRMPTGHLARRHGRSQESRALAGNRRSSSVSMRSHKESSISGTLDVRGAGSYTQSYPQMWITVHGRGFPGRRRGDTGHEAPGSDLSSARSAVDEGELVLHSCSRAERRPLRAQGVARERERAHVTIGENGAARGSRALTCRGAGQ